MARSIRGYRPRRTSAIIDIKQSRLGFIAQPDTSALGGKTVGGRADPRTHRRHSIKGLKRRRIAGQDKEGATLDHRAGREGVVNCARDAVSADILKEGIA